MACQKFCPRFECCNVHATYILVKKHIQTHTHTLADDDFIDCAHPRLLRGQLLGMLFLLQPLRAQPRRSRITTSARHHRSADVLMAVAAVVSVALLVMVAIHFSVLSLHAKSCAVCILMRNAGCAKVIITILTCGPAHQSMVSRQHPSRAASHV